MVRYAADDSGFECRARRPTQLLATECAAKKPNVNSATPAMISASAFDKVSARPPAHSSSISASTRVEPRRSARRPAQGEENMPTM